jgi:hypothetical protein
MCSVCLTNSCLVGTNIELGFVAIYGGQGRWRLGDIADDQHQTLFACTSAANTKYLALSEQSVQCSFHGRWFANTSWDH